jgi:hypothetical protein
MRPRSRPIVLWALTLAAVAIVSTRTLDRDLPPRPIAGPAFTVYVVDQSGGRQPVAHYNGRTWAPICDGRTADTASRSGGRPDAVLAVEGSRGAPLYPVRLLSSEPRRWQQARDAVQALTNGEVDVPGRIREAAVYVPVGVRSDAVFVDLVLRAQEPSWWGVAASGWVLTSGDHPVVLAPRVIPFATYDEFIATPRLHPLGVADVGAVAERVWVMQHRAPDRAAVEIVHVSATGASTAARVPQAGC